MKSTVITNENSIISIVEDETSRSTIIVMKSPSISINIEKKD